MVGFYWGLWLVIGVVAGHVIHRREAELASRDSESGPLMREGSFGFRLVQHNNPFLPGGKRQQQTFSGTCQPDQVRFTLFILSPIDSVILLKFPYGWQHWGLKWLLLSTGV